MAVKARTWTTVDKEIADILATEKDTRKLSYRDIAKMTGMKHMRVSDIIHMVNGTPTVVEFISICETFGLDPATTLRRIIARAAEIETAESASPSGERRPAAGVGEGSTTTARVTDDLIDRIAAHPEDYDVAANEDPNKVLEAETPRD